jgi:hypothetical protein
MTILHNTQRQKTTHAESIRTWKQCNLLLCLYLGIINRSLLTDERVRGSIVGLHTMLQVGRSGVRLPMRSLEFFNWPNPSSRTMAQGSTQTLIEISTRNLPGGKDGRRVMMTTSSPSVSRMSTKCRSLDVSQPYVSPRHVAGIALPLLTDEIWQMPPELWNWLKECGILKCSPLILSFLFSSL